VPPVAAANWCRGLGRAVSPYASGKATCADCATRLPLAHGIIAE
jgi:hypothetical protein